MPAVLPRWPRYTFLVARTRLVSIDVGHLKNMFVLFRVCIVCLQLLTWVTAALLVSGQVPEIVDDQLEQCIYPCLAKAVDCDYWIAPMGPAIYYTYGVAKCQLPLLKCKDECKRLDNIRKKKQVKDAQ